MGVDNIIDLANKLANMIHIVAAVIWVGGMFFAYMALRPAAAEVLDSSQRLRLWVKTFNRFFPWVFIMVFALPLSGAMLIYGYKPMTGNYHIHVMIALGILMILIFLHVYFAPFKRLRNAVKTEDWIAAGESLVQIRTLVGINLLLGLTTVIVASLFSLV